MQTHQSSRDGGGDTESSVSLEQGRKSKLLPDHCAGARQRRTSSRKRSGCSKDQLAGHQAAGRRTNLSMAGRSDWIGKDNREGSGVAATGSAVLCVGPATTRQTGA